MDNKANQVLTAIRETLATHLPKGSRALLYGSQARGDAHPDSDWDILIILDKERLEPSDYDEVSYPLTTLGWDLGEQIHPIMYTLKEWLANAITPFHKNVEREGLSLV